MENYINKSTSIKQELSSTIRIVVIMFLICFGIIFVLSMLAQNTYVTITRGSLPITKTSLYGSYSSTVVFLEETVPKIAFVIIFIIMVLSLVYSINILVHSKLNTIATRIFMCIKVIIISFIFSVFFYYSFYLTTQIIKGVHFESCWCGENYVKISYKEKK